MTQDTDSNPVDYQTVVEDMMDTREPFGNVEAFINRATALDANQKAALWLLAWSMRSGSAQRREARAMVRTTTRWVALD